MVSLRTEQVQKAKEQSLSPREEEFLQFWSPNSGYNNPAGGLGSSLHLA